MLFMLVDDQGSNGAQWGKNFGGGILTITAKATIGGVEVSDTYVGKIEGETFAEDTMFKEYICRYLETPSGAQNYQSILNELGHNEVFWIIAYQETKYQHFYPSIYGDPKDAIYPRENSGGDGGFGVMQLTIPVPSYLQTWNWKENINAGVNLVKDKLRIAKNRLKESSGGQLPSTDSVGKSILRMETYYQYGPHKKGIKTYWKWDNKKNDWVFSTKLELYADTLRLIEDAVDDGDFDHIPDWKYNGEP